MSDQQQTAPGGHYSGRNKIPTVNEFIEKLDRDKKSRDQKIDEERQARAAAGNDTPQPHQEQVRPKENQQRVTDPTTGKQVIIEDVNEEMVKASRDPMVRTLRTREYMDLMLTSASFRCPMPTLASPQ